MSTALERALLHERDGGICGFCGTPVDLSDADVDHVIPRALGGTTTPANVRLAHATCNRSASWAVRKAVGGPRSSPAVVDTWVLEVPADLGKQVRQLAAREHRTLTAQVQVLLRRALASAEHDTTGAAPLAA